MTHHPYDDTGPDDLAVTEVEDIDEATLHDDADQDPDTVPSRGDSAIDEARAAHPEEDPRSHEED